MKITKNIGMLLLAVYLILDGLLGFGLNLGPAIFLLYLVALAAGVLILSRSDFSRIRYLKSILALCVLRMLCG